MRTHRIPFLLLILAHISIRVATMRSLNSHVDRYVAATHEQVVSVMSDYAIEYQRKEDLKKRLIAAGEICVSFTADNQIDKHWKSRFFHVPEVIIYEYHEKAHVIEYCDEKDTPKGIPDSRTGMLFR